MIRNSKLVKLCLLLISSILLTQGFAQNELTADQVFKEFHANFDAFKDKYDGKVMRVTGKVKYKYTDGNDVGVQLTNDGFNTPLELVFTNDPQIKNINVGSTITAEGTASRFFAGALGKVMLRSCSLVNSKTEPEKTAVTKSVAPKDLPMGKYSLYQGGLFTPQGSLTLYSNGTYKRYEKDMGRYNYNSTTKVIRFTSGLLEGFVGIYYTAGRNNDKNESMIAIDFNGKVPDISNASNGQYLYGIYDKQQLL